MKSDAQLAGENLLRQRNQAFSAVLIVGGLSLTLVMNNFMGQRRSLIDAHHEIDVMTSTLIVTQESLRRTEKALLETQSALKREMGALDEMRQHR